MKFDLSNDIDVKKFDHLAKSVVEKKSFVELKKIHPVRSNQQNRYLHVLLGYFAAEYGEQMDYIKQVFFKELINTDIFKSEYTNSKTGEVREDWRSTSDLDTKELTEAIDRFRDYASKEANIYLPEPDEEQFLKSCEIEIEKQKQYI